MFHFDAHQVLVQMLAPSSGRVFIRMFSKHVPALLQKLTNNLNEGDPLKSNWNFELWHCVWKIWTGNDIFKSCWKNHFIERIQRQISILCMQSGKPSTYNHFRYNKTWRDFYMILSRYRQLRRSHKFKSKLWHSEEAAVYACLIPFKHTLSITPFTTGLLQKACSLVWRAVPCSQAWPTQNGSHYHSEERYSVM